MYIPLIMPNKLLMSFSNGITTQRPLSAVATHVHSYLVDFQEVYNKWTSAHTNVKKSLPLAVMKKYTWLFQAVVGQRRSTSYSKMLTQPPALRSMPRTRTNHPASPTYEGRLTWSTEHSDRPISI
jgi:hypothetical protein